MKLENLEKREEIVIKKDETPAKARATAMPKVRDGFCCCFISKMSVLNLT